MSKNPSTPWVRFELLDTPAWRKTQTWEVVIASSGGLLGRVEWFSHWRRYVFVPVGGTSYDQSCLREIAAFVEARTASHRKARR